MTDLCATRFLEAAASGRIDALKALLAQGVSINIQNDSGETAMHRCAMNGQVEAAKFLLDRGIDPDIRDHTNVCYTPFMWACSLGKIEMAALLMPLVDDSVLDSKGVTAAEKAENHGHTHVLAMMRSHEARKVANALVKEIEQPLAFFASP